MQVPGPSRAAALRRVADEIDAINRETQRDGAASDCAEQMAAIHAEHEADCAEADRRLRDRGFETASR